MTAVAPPTAARSGALPTVRRLIVFALLFTMVVIAANGVGGLLGRLLDAGNYGLAGTDVSGLALALAFALVAGPLAALLWWLLWRRIGDDAERSSVAWGLYLAGIVSVALVTFTTALLSMAAALVRGDWEPYSLATGLAWWGVWMWHRWMWLHPGKRPTRLRDVVPIVGSVYGLLVGAGGAVSALGTVFGAAIGLLTDSVSVGEPWWRPALQALVWAAGGFGVWWWHWIREGARSLRTGFADVALVLVAGFGAVLLALGGLATTLFVLLRLAVDRTEPLSGVLDPLGPAVASALVGAFVWTYYRRLAALAAQQPRQAVRLTTSGLALAAAASGIGIIVNSTLAALGRPLAETGTLTLFLGGLSALLVGGPVWWLVWKPATSPDRGSTGRRIYLVVVFGASAIVALVALLVIGFRLFEFALDSVSGQSLLDRVRAPLGLLLATGLAAGYHFAVWMKDRAAAPAQARTPRAIGRVFLVTGSDPEPLRRAVRAATGAEVTVLRCAPDGGTAPTPDQLALALAGVNAPRVLIIAGPQDRLEVIRLLG